MMGLYLQEYIEGDLPTNARWVTEHEMMPAYVELPIHHKALAPRLLQACETLSALNLPDTLEHGDLHAGQFFVQNDKLWLLDWSDSTITHPLLSLPFFLAELANELPDSPDAEARLRRAYFAEWSQYASVDELETLYTELAMVSALFSTLRYIHDILPQMTYRWEMHNMVVYNLRWLLRVVN